MRRSGADNPMERHYVEDFDENGGLQVRCWGVVFCGIG